MSVNAFRITLHDGTPVGMCFDPKLALANHSCVPNAFISFDGRVVSLRALRALGPGVEVRVSYIDPSMPRLNRRDQLKDRYFFNCECRKCVRDESPYQTFLVSNTAETVLGSIFISRDKLVHRAQSLATVPIPPGLPEARDSLNTSDNSSIGKLKESLNLCLPLLSQEAYAIQPVPHLLHELYLAYLDKQDLASALVVQVFKYAHCDVYNYPETIHPTRMITLYSIARLLRALAQDPESLSNTDDLVTKSLWLDLGCLGAHYITMAMVMRDVEKSHSVDSLASQTVRIELDESRDVLEREWGDVGKSMVRWGGHQGSNTSDDCEGTDTVLETLARLETIGDFMTNTWRHQKELMSPAKKWKTVPNHSD